MDTQSIEEALRQVVRSALARDEELTVNSARSQVEKQLNLASDFFKSDPEWKTKSKDIINDAYQESAQTPAKSAAEKRASPSAKEASSRPQKRAKTKGTAPDAGEDSRQAGRGKVDAGSDHDDAGSRVPAAPIPKKDSPEETPGSDSEMSVVIDISPPTRKKKRKKSEQSEQDSTEKSKAKQEKKASQSLTADQEMVKTLQSQLTKCGVRKFWPRELAKFDTDKAKIGHLRRMLQDVGMTGRFSAARAAEIKEARELQEELEATQEFQQKWGTDGPETGRARRSKATRPSLAGLDDDHDDDDKEEDDGPVRAGPHTGLVDFGDSGDSGSD